MFKVDDAILDTKNQITHRSLGYGRDDLGDKAKKFVWVESIVEFMQTCENDINEFIIQCKIDDPTLPEPDIIYLFNLNYPSAQELLEKYPDLLCELLLDYDDLLINRPYFDIPYFEKKRPFIFHGFAINNIDRITIKNDEIVLEGVGYFF